MITRQVDNHSPVTSRLLSDTELAYRLGVTEAYLNELRIPGATQIGSFRRWNSEAIDNWIEAGCPDER